ncbi:MAG: hypothetical protein J6C13_04685 [Clostridia bacterium]|nr:hypothetical protein [Clostridia bacterium]
MKQNNLSTTKFCKMCRITPVTLNKIFNQIYTVRMTSLIRIGIVMDIDYRTLINNEDFENNSKKL